MRRLTCTGNDAPLRQRWHAACSIRPGDADCRRFVRVHSPCNRKVLARVTSPARVLDPVERASEVLFGVLMVMTVTGSVSVAERGAADTRGLLAAAIGGNVAWGLVDAAMYLMANLTERARALATLRALRLASDGQRANELVLDALPPMVGKVLTPAEIGSLGQRLVRITGPDALDPVRRADFSGAVGVFLLVVLATVPLVIPFLVITETAVALRLSNAIGVVMLFGIGWSLGRYAEQSGWRVGLILVAVGATLAGVIIALGG